MPDEMTELELPDHRWVPDDSRSNIAAAACITVATGLSWEQALLVLGGRS